ncbi:hypothetical protein HK405_012814, partial [Cladochytrium tenue]
MIREPGTPGAAAAEPVGVEGDSDDDAAWTERQRAGGVTPAAVEAGAGTTEPAGAPVEEVAEVGEAGAASPEAARKRKATRGRATQATAGGMGGGGVEPNNNISSSSPPGQQRWDGAKLEEMGRVFRP